MLLHHAATRDSIRQLFDAVKAISVQGYDEERRVVYWNVGSELLYGYTEAEALGRKLEELIIPECMCNVVVTSHKRWVDEGVEIPASEIILRNKNGQDVSVFSSHVLFEDENNKKEMYCIDIDLAEVRQAQAQVIFKENMLKAVFEATPDLFFLMQEDGTIIDYYVGDKKNLYVLPKDILGKSMSDFLPEKVVKNFKSHFVKIIEQGGVSSFEYELSMPHGLTQFEARIIYLQSDKKIVVIVRDITEQHKAAEVIRKHAYFDNLTSLPNRFLSLDRLWQMLKKAKRNADNVAVFFLDLDDFKKVNDSLGHEVGDKLLVEAANRLKLVVRESDTVGRLGGDEFIVLSQALTNGHDAIDIAENLLGIFREPFKIDGRELSLTVSIGIAIYPENGGSASDLLRNADTAMYQAKALGRNAYSFFTRAMNDITLRRLEIEGYLHNALERDEFEVYY